MGPTVRLIRLESIWTAFQWFTLFHCCHGAMEIWILLCFCKRESLNHCARCTVAMIGMLIVSFPSAYKIQQSAGRTSCLLLLVHFVGGRGDRKNRAAFLCCSHNQLFPISGWDLFGAWRDLLITSSVHGQSNGSTPGMKFKLVSRNWHTLLSMFETRRWGPWGSATDSWRSVVLM